MSHDGHNYRLRIVLMWAYVTLVYLPFFIFMLTSHDVARLSMSNIAWNVGYKIHLVIYLILTFPFCLFMLLFLNRHFVGNYKTVWFVSVVSCVLIVSGAFVPLRYYEQYAWMNLLHTVLSVGGTVVFMLTITATLIIYAIKCKVSLIVYFLYGLFVLGLLVAFIILWTAALFQLVATLSFMLILLVVNTVSLLSMPRAGCIKMKF